MQNSVSCPMLLICDLLYKISIQGQFEESLYSEQTHF